MKHKLQIETCNPFCAVAGLRVVHEQGSKKVAAESSNFPADWQHASPKSSSFYKPFNVWAPGPFVPFEAFHTNSHFSQCPVSAPRFDNWPAYWGSANCITPFAGCPAFTSKTHAAGETNAVSTIPDLKKWKKSFSKNLSVYCFEIDTPLWQCLRVRLRSSSGLPQLAAKLPFFECSSFPKCAFCFTNLVAKSKVGELPIRIATVGAEGCRQRNCSESPTSTDTVERVKANAHGADRRSWHLGFPATHLSPYLPVRYSPSAP